MKLKDLSLDGLEHNWSSAFAVASAWIPSLSGCYDSRFVQIRGRELLTAFILVTVLRLGHIATMKDVRDLIDEEMSIPGTILEELLQIETDKLRQISAECLAARGCWFSDAVPFLDLKVKDEHAYIVKQSWPNLKLAIQ